MKILYLSPGCFDMGGISRYNRYQIQSLREIVGQDNVVVYSLLGKEKDGFKEDFKVNWSANGIKFSDKIAFAIKTFVKGISWRPDIILCAHVNLSGLAHFVAIISGAKSVLNTYGLEVWSGLSKDSAWGLKNSNYVISDCHFTSRYLESEGLRIPGTTTVIWDCVNLDVFQPQKNHHLMLKKYRIPDPNKYFNILTLGRLAYSARHKGYERLIQVFKEVAKVEDKARLIFAGKGDYSQELKNLAKKEGLVEKVYFTGMIADEDMAKVYSAAHVFSLVSDRGKNRGEGIPLTPLEAMACGIPIIVGNQDGSQEAVFDEKNGFIIDPFDLSTHKTKILKLIQNPELLNEKKQNTSQIVKAHFSYNKFKEKHILFLRNISQ